MFNVTVGVCVKNMPKTLKLTVESLLRQEMADRSCVMFVFPSPSDPSYQVYRESLDRLVEKYASVGARFDGGRGLAAARQMVVDWAAATSKYIVWVDGDHVIPPTFISRHYQFMESNPDCGACNSIPLWMGGRRHQKLEGLTWMYYTLRLAESGGRLNRLGTAGGCYRVEAVMSAGGFDPRFKVAAEDGDLTYRMWSMGWTMLIDAENYYYHVIRERVLDVMKEYRGWGYGALMEVRKNLGRSGDKRLFRFMLSPATGLVYGFRYRRFVKTGAFAKYPVGRVEVSPADILYNSLFYALKRYSWVVGYLEGLLSEKID